VSDDVEIRSYPDGPFLVRGPVRVLGEEGEEVEIRRRIIALCRCGRSRLQPFCDGTHAVAVVRERAGDDAGTGTTS
jgi:CDGSH-type Zn-finger protein